MEKYINKVRITEEAKVDYELISQMPLPVLDIKQDTELYIDLMQENDRLLWGYYFKCKYYDEQSDKMLYLFFYKGNKYKRMQVWDLKGICEQSDWSEELETSGQIRSWLKSSIATDDKTDWVWEERIRQRKQQKLLEMIENENYGEDYEKMVKELLKKYKHNRRIITLGTNDVGLVDKMDFLDKCIEQIEEDGGDIIKDIYINGMSLSKVGKKHGYSKGGIQYKRDRALDILEVLFNQRYEI